MSKPMIFITFVYFTVYYFQKDWNIWWESRFKIELRLTFLAPFLSDKLLSYLSSLHLKNLSLVFLEDILLCICFFTILFVKETLTKLIIYNFLFHLYENQLIWCIRRTPSKSELFFFFLVKCLEIRTSFCFLLLPP